MNNKLSPNADYVILNVPYVGIYNHKGTYEYLGLDSSSAIASILEYWNPGKNDFAKIRNSMPKQGEFLNLERIQGIVGSQGEYKIERVHLGTNELKKYINPETKTPLLLFLPMDPDQPKEASAYFARVLIGIKESEKKIILHDFWLGNNYEISFDDFDRLWNNMRPEVRNYYIAIQPTNLDEKLKEIKSRLEAAYTPRTQIMQNAEIMMKNYAIGRQAYNRNLWDIALDYFLKVKNDSSFEEYWPPYLKTSLFYLLADIYKNQQGIDKAREYANQATELNHDLDKPFKDWPGFEVGRNNPAFIDRMSGPFRVLGDVCLQNGEFEKAKENYLKALDIQPTNSKAQAGLAAAAAEEAISKK